MSTEPDGLDDDRDDQPLEIKDPDDYNQARRLKTIHQARDDVRKARRNVTKGRANQQKHTKTHQELAQAVATYGHELLPLMNKAGWEHEYPEEGKLENVRDFIYAMGSPKLLRDEDAPYMPTHISMGVYARLNEFMAEIGLGADFDDDNTEWEI